MPLREISSSRDREERLMRWFNDESPISDPGRSVDAPGDSAVKRSGPIRAVSARPEMLITERVQSPPLGISVDSHATSSKPKVALEGQAPSQDCQPFGEHTQQEAPPTKQQPELKPTDDLAAQAPAERTGEVWYTAPQEQVNSTRKVDGEEDSGANQKLRSSGKRLKRDGFKRTPRRWSVDHLNLEAVINESDRPDAALDSKNRDTEGGNNSVDRDDSQSQEKAPNGNLRSVNSKSALHEALQKPEFRDVIYNSFLATFSSLQDETESDLQHQVAKWVANQVQELAHESTKIVEQVKSRQANLEGQLKMTLAQQEETLAAEYHEELRRTSAKQGQELAAVLEAHERELDQKDRHYADIKRRYEDALAESKKSATKASATHEEAIAKLNEQIYQKDEEIALKQQAIEEKQRSIEESREKYEAARISEKIEALEETRNSWREAFQKAQADREKEMKDLEQSHNEKIKQLEQNNHAHLSDMKKELSTLATNAASDQQKLREAHRTSLVATNEKQAKNQSELVQRYEEQTKELKRRLDDMEEEAEKIDIDWRARHTREIDELQRKYKAERAAETAQLEDQIKKRETEHSSEQVRFNDTIQTLKVYHAKQMEEVHSRRAIERDQARHELSSTMRSLQRQVHELNDALLNYDDEKYVSKLFTPSGLPNRPDDDIRSRLSMISVMVENFGRMQWKEGQELWTAPIFEKIGKDRVPRIVRRAIVQDLVWSLLFRRIFCSPFRVLGEEGEALEKEWSEQFGVTPGEELYTWPEPGIHAERWRYFTIKECREALMKPLPSKLDPRARLKTGFKKNVDALIDELKLELGNVLDLESANVQLIERLTRTAASTWLDFMMHRCRIIISLTGNASESAAAKVAQIQDSGLALTVVPMLCRYGNVKGVELDTFVAIETGESLTIP